MENTNIENTSMQDTNEKAHYSYETNGNGLTIEFFTPEGDSFIFAQGDDASTFIEEIEEIEKLEYPRGPFSDAEDAVDEYISQYRNDD